MEAKKLQGAISVKPFAHKAKVRRRADDDQSLRMSPWGHVAEVSTKVDLDRVNWKGILYLQQASGMFDPRPRLRRLA